VAARIDAILAGENAGQNSGQNQENLVSREGIEPVGEAEGRSRLPEFFAAKPPRTK
jgi:hypothetical protein